MDRREELKTEVMDRHAFKDEALALWPARLGGF